MLTEQVVPVILKCLIIRNFKNPGSQCQTEIKLAGYSEQIQRDPHPSGCSDLSMNQMCNSEHLETQPLPNGSFCGKQLWLKDIADRLTAAERIIPEARVSMAKSLQFSFASAF